MDFSYSVEGLGDLNALLKQLPEDLGRKAANAAVRVGGNTLRKEIRARISDKNGKLFKSILVRKKPDTQGSVNFEVVSVSPIAHLVEFGTSPHHIEISSKKILSNGTATFGTSVNHPGAKAEPFFRPGTDAGAERAVYNMREVMAKAIAKQAEKFAK